MNMATKTILGLAAVAAMTFISTNDASAHCGANHGYGGGRGISVQIGGGYGNGFGGYGRGFGGYGYGGGFGNSVVRTSYYAAPIYRQPAVQVYRAPQVIVAPRVPVRGYGRPGCGGGYGYGW